MPDYKAMYYKLSGRMAVTVEALEATTTALATIAERLKQAQQTAEEMYMKDEDENSDEDGEESE